MSYSVLANAHIIISLEKGTMKMLIKRDPIVSIRKEFVASHNSLVSMSLDLRGVFCRMPKR